MFAVRHILCLLCLILMPVHALGEVEASREPVTEILADQVDPAVLRIIFSGKERLHYAVSWSGGVKIGDIYMEIRPEPGQEDAFLITTTVRACGPLAVFYPVDDQFLCSVQGPLKLPHRYEVRQKEGFGTVDRHVVVHYDQEQKTVSLQKNNGEPKLFTLTGNSYNEFASFIITRALRFNGSGKIVVPTFVDDKRHEVKVGVVKWGRTRTRFGRQNTLEVHPELHFKGVYDKSGNTVLWLTDDQCRVPVEIQSRIVVGSLTAELVDYSNPSCPELHKPSGR